MSTELTKPEPRSIVADSSAFAGLLDSAKFEHLQRVAKVFAASELVPAHFRDKPANCIVALQMALRLQVDPFMFLQNCYLISGKPSIETKLAIALLNASGRISGSVRYKVEGSGEKLACTAYCVESGTGEVLEHRLDWETVKRCGWAAKGTWATDPKLMMMYRSAMRLIRTHFPDVLLGMLSKEEAEEIGTVEVRPSKVRLADKLKPAPVAELAEEPHGDAWEGDEEGEAVQRQLMDTHGNAAEV